MTISTLDALFNAMANNSSRFVVNKTSIANQTAGQLASMWRAAGQPAQAAIPGTTPEVPTEATLGAIDFASQTSPATSYLPWIVLNSGNTGGGFEIHDRVAHMGGLVLNVTTAQNITGLDLNTIGLPAERRGAADFSDLQWFLEVYTDGGATASNATIAVTYDDATTGNLNVVAVGGSLRAGRFIPLIPFIPTAKQGRKIGAINSVTLSASTGTAGNFGFTCTRQRTAKAFGLANNPVTLTWQDGAPEIQNDSCLMIAILCATTSTGAVAGQGKISHG
ncbi:MAG: hypothetical protein MUE52_04510 [Tabrizicola sp.]|jgi:hypothetical protein|nr:hypothetical protein [Tabrizicola sp.]